MSYKRLQVEEPRLAQEIAEVRYPVDYDTPGDESARAHLLENGFDENGLTLERRKFLAATFMYINCE